MRYSNEPLFWALFSAGGVVAALLIPVLIVLTGFAVPAEQITFAHLEDVLGHPLVRLVLFGVALLVFVHWANRFRHTLYDMGVPKSWFAAVGVLSYAVALAGTVYAGVVAVG